MKKPLIVWVLAGALVASLAVNVFNSQVIKERQYPLLAKRLFVSNPNDLIINFTSLRQELKTYLATQKERIGVYFEYLPTGVSVGLNDREEFYRASLVKLPGVMRTYKLIEEGKLNEDDQLEVKDYHINTNFGSVENLQPITLTGKALYGATIVLYLDGKQIGEFSVKENLSDNQKQLIDIAKTADDEEVEWRYTVHSTLLPGRHSMYAVQVKPDKSESERSNEVSVRVLASSIQLGGVIIPMFVLLLLLLLLLLVTLFLFLLLWRKKRSQDDDWKEKIKEAEKAVEVKLGDLEKRVTHDIDTIRSKSAVSSKIEKDIEQSKEDVDLIFDEVVDKKEKE